MNYVARKNIAIIIGIIFFVLILACIAWVCMVVTDYVRYRLEEIPIFAYNVTISDLENGDIEEYKGVGYKYIDKTIDGVNTKEFHLFGIQL